MEQTQSTGSEPYGQPAPPPMVAAPTPARRTDVSKPGLVIAVIALALALIGMVAFPGPVGEEGPQGEIGPRGPTGDDGDDGSDGAQGPTGPQGLSGADGADGIACWDLNGDGTGDLPAEDINGDLVVDVLDCAGPQGPQGTVGPQGPAGPGTLMSYSSWISQGNIGDGAGNCIDLPVLNVTITAPSDGFVVTWAHVNAYIDHDLGTEDLWVFLIETSPTDCVNLEGFSLDTISADVPSDSNMQRSSSLQAIFPISAGQTVTYYVNGYMTLGWDVDDVFGRGSVIAVFYPS